MTSISQTIPQWQINQIFEAAPAVVVNALRPLIIGPDYAVRRYSANKALVSLGTYAAGSQLAVAWPSIQAGEVVDQSYTSINIDSAASQYYSNPSSDVAVVAGHLNEITSASLSFATNGTYARSAGIPTDVLVGDQVVLTEGGTTLVTTVTGLVANVLAASIGSSTALAGNVGTAAGSSTETAGGSNVGTAVPSVSGLANPANYQGQGVGAHGQMSETYTVTVTAAGSDCLGNTGAWTSAQLSVTSASGTDATQTGIVPVPGTPFAVGSRGARFELSHGVSGNDLVVGDTWTVAVTQTYTIPTTASGGSYVGPTNTTYVVTVTKGGLTSGSSAGKAQVTISTTTGIDLGGPYTVTSGTPIVIGSLGVTITFTGTQLVVGDGFTIVATAAGNGAIQTLVLANNLPTALQSGTLSLKLAIVQNVVVSQQQVGNAPTLNWVGSSGLITLNSVMQTTNARTGALALTILSGSAYATYRALRTAGANQLQSIVVNSDIALGGFWGLIDDVDSQLTYGINRAISNAAGTTIQAISIASDDLAGYQAALNTLTNRQDFYRVVPLTQNVTIIEAVHSFVNGRSGPSTGKWVTDIQSLALTTIEQLGVAGLTTIAYDSSTGLNTEVINTDGLAKYVTNGVKAGDNFRAIYTTDGFGNVAYTTFIVNAVISEEQLQLVAGPSLPVSVASTSQVWHPLSVAEQATDLGTRSQAVSGGNRRVTSVFPTLPSRGGQVCPNYYLACSLAAMRGAAVPQQGLTNAQVNDWDDMSQASNTFANQLVNLMQYGMWIVSQDPAGTVYVVKQLTCDTTAVANSEDSVTVNVDSCSYVLLGLLAPFIGKTNNVTSNLNVITNVINGGIVQLQNQNYDPSLGGQMGPNAQLVYVRPNAVRLDAVSARVNGDFPIPINNGFLDLIVGSDTGTTAVPAGESNSQPG